ncbi:MAG TPA: LCP family protein [Candidatus Acutalibacter stercorigallinarum]|nr:LCP family protein [Candidatus Acutalibacter stercorigallinarum]
MLHIARDDAQEFEDLSSYSSSKEYNKRRKNRRGHTVLKCILGVFCALLIVFGSGLIYIATHLLDDLTTTNITKDPTALGIDPSVTMDDSIKNIALFGLDQRSAYSDDSTRSDVIMVLTVDNKHKKLKITSILRDSYVSIEGENSNGVHVDYMDKINAAYAEGGYELAIRTLNRNFGLNIMDYVTIDFTDTAAIVDAFGGVEISLTAEEKWEINQNLWNLSQETEGLIKDSDFLADANGEVVDLAGAEYSDSVELLNGNQAVAYGRIRNIGYDYQRVERQQIVFKALMNRVTQLSFGEYPSLISQLMPYCETSLDLTDAIGMTPILTSDFTIETISVPDVDYELDLTDDGSYLYYDVEQAGHRIDSFINEEDSDYWEEFGNSGATPAEGTAEQEALDKAAANSGSSNNYSGHSDSYNNGSDDGYTDSYDTGYDTGYSDNTYGDTDGYYDGSYDTGSYDSTGDSYNDGYGAGYDDSYDTGTGGGYYDTGYAY